MINKGQAVLVNQTSQEWRDGFEFAFACLKDHMLGHANSLHKLVDETHTLLQDKQFWHLPPKQSPLVESGFKSALSKVDNEIDAFFFELKGMKDALDQHDWTMNELAGGMLALSMLKRRLIDMFVMKAHLSETTPPV